ncbi:addiction module protein [Ramlibacter sp.]|uniref:addiction module protein n=1 Tax=Ramlibacter sp. TaxID=1917967 RepID=UPI00184E6C89|nr:addiction module protein [Ramlibacter sp.]MBA2674474.1 addiction module protein [Ramlibacter sp.]
MSTASITQQALDLPLAERVAVAQALWASIDDQLAEVDVLDAVLVARERDAAFDTGAVAGLSHEQVMQDARRRIG